MAVKTKKKRLTKLERMNKARRTARKRGIAKAAGALLKKMNPASHAHAVRVKKLKGGGVSITPLKVTKKK